MLLEVTVLLEVLKNVCVASRYRSGILPVMSSYLLVTVLCPAKTNCIQPENRWRVSMDLLYLSVATMCVPTLTLGRYDGFSVYSNHHKTSFTTPSAMQLKPQTCEGQCPKLHAAQTIVITQLWH